MKIERELMRGAGPMAVLKALEAGERYGYQLVEEIERRTRGALRLGQSTLYPMLYNLEAKALIEANWREGDTGRKRKYYRLTQRGRRELKRRTREWQTVESAMQLLGVLRPATH